VLRCRNTGDRSGLTAEFPCQPEENVTLGSGQLLVETEEFHFLRRVLWSREHPSRVQEITDPHVQHLGDGGEGGQAQSTVAGFKPAECHGFDPHSLGQRFLGESSISSGLGHSAPDVCDDFLISLPWHADSLQDRSVAVAGGGHHEQQGQPKDLTLPGENRRIGPFTEPGGLWHLYNGSTRILPT